MKREQDRDRTAHGAEDWWPVAGRGLLLALLFLPVSYLLWKVERAMGTGYATAQGRLILVAGLGWLLWRGWRHRGKGDLALAVFLGGVGVAMMALGAALGKYTVMHYALVPLVGATVTAAWGRKALRTSWVGLALVLLSIPISIEASIRWLRPITEPEREAVAWLTTQVLRLAGVVAWREDVAVTLLGREGPFVLKVEMMCSGYGYLGALLAVVLPYLALQQLPYRRVMVVALVPVVSVLANTVRVVANGLVAAYAGGGVGFAFSHTWSGYAMLVASAVVLLVLDLSLQLMWNQWRRRWVMPSRRGSTPRVEVSSGYAAPVKG